MALSTDIETVRKTVTERTLNCVSARHREACYLYQWSEGFGLDFLEMRINDPRGMNDICSCRRLFTRVVTYVSWKTLTCQLANISLILSTNLISAIEAPGA